MADSEDKHDDGAHKKTLTLKGGPSVGARPGMSRGPARTAQAAATQFAGITMCQCLAGYGCEAVAAIAG